MQSAIAEAKQRLLAGEVIAFPTETVFGLGADPRNIEAIKKLLKCKSRNVGEGFPCLLSQSQLFFKYIDVSTEYLEKIDDLIAKHWPGPLTLVGNASEFALQTLVPECLGPNQTLALRYSPHPFASLLADCVGGVLPATSANEHGKPAANSKKEVLEYFPDMFCLELSDSINQGSLPSTILSIAKYPFTVLRSGAVDLENCSDVIYT